ncbi:alpha/beta hydrolase family protein [Terrarubrum flagellatum]|uniref:alpha/beta hydrolase family protein n=1 Tax=Terrirubrum flagellatum TaxID=2895980 RepID=UPI003144F1DC
MRANDIEIATRRTLWRLLGDFPRERFEIAERQALELRLPGARAERLDLIKRNGEHVRAILTGPEGEWRGFPALLYCHAHGGKYEIGASELIAGRPALLTPPYAQALADRGFVVLCIDMPCFGERTHNTESELAKRHLWRGQTLFGVMLTELIAAIDLLASMKEVDGERIGAMGISMGATHAFWLGALDTRIKAIAHLCCFADLAMLVSGGGHDRHGIYMTVPNLLDHISTGRIAGLAAPRPQLACIGLRDPLTPEDAARTAIEDARASYRRAGAESALEILIDAETGHQETPAMRKAVLDFLTRNLG